MKQDGSLGEGDVGGSVNALDNDTVGSGAGSAIGTLETYISASLVEVNFRQAH